MTVEPRAGRRGSLIKERGVVVGNAVLDRQTRRGDKAGRNSEFSDSIIKGSITRVEMAQLLRQKLGPMLLRRSASVQPKQIPKRTFSSSAQHEDAEEAVKWRNITIAGYVTCTLLGAYILTGSEHHNEERPQYSYLHIRNKEFPWGPDGLFEVKKEHH